jgi:lipoprotein signal peptidase
MIGLKCGSLSNGLSAIVLAQIAILAFTNPGVDYSFDNALGGMVFGGADLLIGLLMVFIYFQKRKIPTPSEKRNED